MPIGSDRGAWTRRLGACARTSSEWTPCSDIRHVQPDLVRVADRIRDVPENANGLVPRVPLKSIIEAEQSARLVGKPLDEGLARWRDGRIPPRLLTHDVHDDAVRDGGHDGFGVAEAVT